MARDPHPTHHPPAGPATGPMAAWVLVQLAALALAALRVPVAAQYPRPEESLAPHVLLATQVIASALLFPFLLRDWLTSIAILAAAWPFAAVAASLSSVPVQRISTAEAYVMTWIVGLALWGVRLRETRAISYAVAVASLLAIGGLALGYLGLEFGSSAATVGESGARLNVFWPALGAVDQLNPAGPRWVGWVTPTALVATGVLLRVGGRIFLRDRLSTAPAPDDSTQRPITP